MSRFDVLWHPGSSETVLELVERWARDRVVPQAAHRRLVQSVYVSLSHGLRFHPRAVTVLVRWDDVERVRIDLRWHAGDACAEPDDGGGYDVEAHILSLNALTRAWGIGRTRSGWVQWLLVDL